ncbi:hypothetical protein AVEN_195310-1 [Araneus ventricosus]|uniref:Uncharacterized protein n=1 Tax=Araneus ventricosus TaxID=182803 RepID=A0A4Y2IBD9_ARAVE|nr:hypothetical protein AVEN_195310-1 [Araneus ventricosus]
MASENADLLLHNKVRRLSEGNALKLYASLLFEIKAFLLEKSVDYPELTETVCGSRLQELMRALKPSDPEHHRLKAVYMPKDL